MRKIIRVYYGWSEWIVKKDHSLKASSIKHTKNMALRVARRIATNQNLTILIHKKDGRLEKTWSFTETGGKLDYDLNKYGSEVRKIPLGCYLTQACVRFKGLPDDCDQLTVLRNFRETYIKNLDGGERMLQEYSAKAPKIISGIVLAGCAKIEYDNIFTMINRAVDLIRKGENKKALSIYLATSLYLERRYVGKGGVGVSVR